jgi:hypothetical protein
MIFLFKIEERYATFSGPLQIMMLNLDDTLFISSKKSASWNSPADHGI